MCGAPVCRLPMNSLLLSRRRRWAGRILSGLVLAFLSMDLAFKFSAAPEVAEANAALGLPLELLPLLGVLLGCCMLLYTVPRTAVLGAVLLTGYLGGAVCAHLRVFHPAFSHTLFPVYVGALAWLGLALRDPRVGLLLSSTPTPGEAP